MAPLSTQPGAPGARLVPDLQGMRERRDYVETTLATIDRVDPPGVSPSSSLAYGVALASVRCRQLAALMPCIDALINAAHMACSDLQSPGGSTKPAQALTESRLSQAAQLVDLVTDLLEEQTQELDCTLETYLQRMKARTQPSEGGAA